MFSASLSYRSMPEHKAQRTTIAAHNQLQQPSTRKHSSCTSSFSTFSSAQASEVTSQQLQLLSLSRLVSGNAKGSSGEGSPRPNPSARTEGPSDEHDAGVEERNGARSHQGGGLCARAGREATEGPRGGQCGPQTDKRTTEEQEGEEDQRRYESWGTGDSFQVITKFSN